MYKNGDILICSTNRYSNSSYDLNIGEQYEVVDSIDLLIGSMNMGAKQALTIKSIKSNTIHYFIPDKLFISLEIYREFKLREILK